MEKKKCPPKLYPLDRDLSKKWFVKYQVPCYITGKYIYKKNSGQLNLLPTVALREQEANSIIQKINDGIPLDLCTGYRTYREKKNQFDNFASIQKLSSEILEGRMMRGEIEESTYITYNSRLHVFHQWLQQSGHVQLPFGSFNISHSKLFLGYLKSEKHFKNGYINSVKTLLFGIWKEIISDKVLKDFSNPWADLASLPNKSTPFLSLNIGLEKRIAKTMPQYDIQLWILTQFIYYEFIRIAELTKMKIHHIDFHQSEITVPEYIARKSKKSRKLVIPKQLMQLLLDNEYHLAEPDMYIFSKGGKPGYNRVGKNYFSRAFSNFREAFKIPSDYKLYGFKHTGNSKLASIGVNAQLQQKHNGHASLEYTQRYNSNLSHADTKFLQEQFPSFAQAGKSLFNESNQKQEFSQEQLLSIARMMKNLLQNTETNAD